MQNSKFKLILIITLWISFSLTEPICLLAKNQKEVIYTLDSLISLAIQTPDSLDNIAIEILNKALKLINEEKDFKSSSEYYLKIGNAFADKNKQLKALDLYQEGLSIAVKSHDSTLMWEFNDAIGLLYHKKANYTSSLEFFFEALNIAEKIFDDQKTAISCDHIVRILKEQREYHKALEYLNKSFNLKTKIGDKEGELITLITIADINALLSNLDQALEIYTECEIIANQLSNKKQLSRVYSNMGNCHFYLKNYSKAEQYFIKGIKIKEELGDAYRLAIAYNNLSIFYKRISKLDNAYETANRALNLSKEASAAYVEMSCYLNLSHYYKLKNNYKNAYNFQRKYAHLKDSLFNVKKSEQLAETREKYETEKKEQQIEFLEIKNKSQETIMRKNKIIRNIISISGILIFLLLIVSVIAFKQKQRSNKLLIDKNEKIEEQNTELDKLNNTKNKLFSIIAHDLRSPLNSLDGISELIEKLLEKNNKEQILKLSKHIDTSITNVNTLLDNLLNWALSQIKRLHVHYEKLDVFEVVNYSIKLQSTVARSKSIELISSVPEGILVNADLNLLRTILRNLISNAIKFTPEGKMIEICANKTGQFAQIDVIDSGIGMNEETANNVFTNNSERSKEGTAGEKGSGLGLMLCKEFVELNKGAIFIESKLNEGTKVSFTLPTFS